MAILFRVPPFFPRLYGKTGNPPPPFLVMRWLTFLTHLLWPYRTFPPHSHMQYLQMHPNCRLLHCHKPHTRKHVAPNYLTPNAYFRSPIIRPTPGRVQWLGVLKALGARWSSNALRDDIKCLASSQSAAYIQLHHRPFVYPEPPPPPPLLIHHLPLERRIFRSKRRRSLLFWRLGRPGWARSMRVREVLIWKGSGRSAYLQVTVS